MNSQTQNSKKVYEIAKSLLGHNLCANGQLGCAETVNTIFTHALGTPVGGGSSTAVMYQYLQDTKRFQKITIGNQLPGDIIISPTGHGLLEHGHVGIIAIYGILSNSSSDGRLHENYDIETWINYFQNHGGFIVEIYRAL